MKNLVQNISNSTKELKKKLMSYRYGEVSNIVKDAESFIIVENNNPVYLDSTITSEYRLKGVSLNYNITKIVYFKKDDLVLSVCKFRHLKYIIVITVYTNAIKEEDYSKTLRDKYGINITKKKLDALIKSFDVRVFESKYEMINWCDIEKDTRFNLNVFKMYDGKILFSYEDLNNIKVSE